jgi:hypothetical protein
MLNRLSCLCASLNEKNSKETKQAAMCDPSLNPGLRNNKGLF